MSDSTALKLGKLIVIGMCVQLLVIGYIFYNGYQGRVTVVKAQRAGCERGKLDRKASIVVASNTLDNFRDTDNLRGHVTDKRLRQEAEIEGAIAGLQIRADIVCAKAFPKARLIP